MDSQSQQGLRILQSINQKDSIFSLSPTTMQLIEMASDDRSSARDLAQIIERDPSLTIRLLKLANSAIYGSRQRVSSISQAIVLIGLVRLRVMALSLSLRDTFPIGKADGVDYLRFWQTSLYRAIIGQILAHRIGYPQPEEAFIAGLTLEIGLIMLLSILSKDTKLSFPGMEAPLQNILQWEEKTLGIQHRKVAGVILERWGFPKNLVECQRCYGPPALEPEAPILCQISELCRTAAENFFGENGDFYFTYETANRLFRLQQNQLNQILSETFTRVEETAKPLQIEIDSQKDIMEVMEKANRALRKINDDMESNIHSLTGKLHFMTEITKEMDRENKQAIENTLEAVAHEIRNPLLSVGGFARRLAAKIEEGNDGKKYVDIIVNQASRLDRALTEIINFCKRFEPTFEERDLKEILDRVLASFDEKFREQNIRLVKEYDEAEAIISADERSITQVFTHFLGEAIDSKDGELLGVSIHRDLKAGQVLAEIEHSRPNIPDETLVGLFDPFSISQTFGAGLGFPMAKKIVEGHGLFIGRYI